MLFSTPIFVFLFLPLVLGLYHCAARPVRNGLLLVASLIFYAWGEPVMSIVLLVAIVGNYALGLWVARARARGRGRGVVATAIVFNVALLVAFKYSDWLWNSAGSLLIAVGLLQKPLASIGSHFGRDSFLASTLLDEYGHIRLPIGVSFFTFQATSYVIDIFRGDVPAERSLIDFGMYKSFFPQLIAGPIVRYRDVHVQIHERRETVALFAEGVRRFVLGLGKKVLIANICAQAADKVFGGAGPDHHGIPLGELTPATAWLGMVAYTLQIYFDFSGYSDMAIGLGHMFGFRFRENFEHPYVSRSITEFWRRWHISLSSWFRDYLYIPLGGNRRGPARTYVNLVLVFFLCGLWHGANVTFIVWGLYHGLFLVVERVGLGAWLERRIGVISHAYTLLVVVVGWTFFRADSLQQAGTILRAMFFVQDGSQLVHIGEVAVAATRVHDIRLYADNLTWIAIAAGIVGSTPWLPGISAWIVRLEERGARAAGLGLRTLGLAALALIFVAAASELAAGAYNPFIYFRF